MIAEIAENRVNKFISIRHLGLITNVNIDTSSEPVNAWPKALLQLKKLIEAQGSAA